MNKLFSFLCVSALLFAGTPALRAQRITGNGNVVTKDRPVSSFNEVHSKGSFDITVTDGANHQVRVEAEENLQELIEVKVTGNNLIIQGKKGSNFRATKPIRVYVTAPALQAIKLSGSGNVKTENTLTGSDRFEAKSSGSGNMNIAVETTSLEAAISGSGNMTLKGKTKDFDGSISGSGNIRAKDMQSDNTSIKIAGSGNAEVVANVKLDSRISGSGDVRYWGNASVDTKIAGSGGVHKQH